MSDLPYQEDSRKWAEDKGFIRKCSIHSCSYDASLGCDKCRIEQAGSLSTTSDEWSPFVIIKQGYKYTAGSYWKKIARAESSLYQGQITRNDVDGLWVKVSRIEATDEIRIRADEESSSEDQIQE